MTHTAHTPGPWTVDENGVITGGAHSCTSVATVPLWQWEQCKKRVMANDDVLSFVQTNYQIAKANAALIAAAPELLRGCEAALAYWDSEFPSNRQAAIEIILEAVRKAKGGA